MIWFCPKVPQTIKPPVGLVVLLTLILAFRIMAIEDVKTFRGLVVSLSRLWPNRIRAERDSVSF